MLINNPACSDPLLTLLSESSLFESEMLFVISFWSASFAAEAVSLKIIQLIGATQLYL